MINVREKLIKKVECDKEILAVFLFGSVSRKESSVGSDVDICLVMDKDSYGQEAIFKKRLSYLEEFDLDIQVFQQLPLYIQIRIIREGKILFCRDEDSLYQLAFKVIQEFTDFEHIYHDYLEEVAGAR